MIEIGMVIDQNDFPLVTIFGEPARVEFTDKLIWDYHLHTPGQILTLAHTHPDGFYELSDEDRTTLKAWTMAVSPHRVHMDVICPMPDSPQGLVNYSHRRYYYEMESLQEWLSKGKIGIRKMSLEYKDLSFSDYYPDWLAKIMDFSQYDMKFLQL